MVIFECDTCGNLKQEDDVWLLGFAAEALGAVSARREINMVSSWDYQRAVQPLAVHFCSEECRDDYVARLFGTAAPVPVVERATVLKRVRTLPDERAIVTEVTTSPVLEEHKTTGHVRLPLEGEVVSDRKVVREGRRPKTKAKSRKRKSA